MKEYKIIKMRHYCKLSILAIACCVIFAACTKDVLENGGQEGGNLEGKGVISLSIANDEAVSKAGAASMRRIVADLSEGTGIEGLVLEETVSSMDEMPVATKGTPVYTENFADIYSAGFLAAKVYDSGSLEEIPALEGAVFKQRAPGDNWIYDYGGIELPAQSMFFFNAPATLPGYIGAPSYDAEEETVSFSLVPSKYPTVATAQQDVLFSCEDDIRPSTVNSVNFNHVFAAVKFKQGNTDDILKITKVEISNALKSGSCTIGADGTAAWSQTSPVYGVFSQEYDGDASGANTAKTFQCIPCDFKSTDAKKVIVTITYEYSGVIKTAQIDFSANLNGKKWEAGHMYTYSFNVTALGVTVDDEVSGNIKDEVVITNTGNMPGYIRASIVANWVMEIDGEVVIIGKCDPASEGELEDLGNNWIPGTDGYYYYKYGVNGGQATNEPLFNSYTAGEAPVDGASLQMSILAQIVATRTAWVGVPSGLSDIVEE